MGERFRDPCGEKFNPNLGPPTILKVDKRDASTQIKRIGNLSERMRNRKEERRKELIAFKSERKFEFLRWINLDFFFLW